MADLEDIRRFGKQLQDELERIDHHHPDDRALVERWVQKVDGQVNDSSLVTYLRNLRTTAKEVEGPLCELTEREMDELTYYLRREAGPQGDGLSDGTVRNKQFAVRKFLADLDLQDWAHDYDLVSPPDNKVRPEDMLKADDIAALTSGANNLRDVALIEFLADSGARLSLVTTLRVRDVDLDSDQATYTPNPNARGLKGAPIREYPIIDSRAVLRTYLQQIHPRPDEPDVAFFHALPGHGKDVLEGDGSLTGPTVRAQLRSAAESAGVDKPVNPHNFRHSAVSRMVREGYSRSQIEHRVAWSVDTDMWSTYEHIAADEHNSDIFAAAGVLEEGNEGPSADRDTCGLCQEPLAPHHDYCPRCGEAVSEQARQVKNSAVGSLAEALAAIDDPERREHLAEALRGLESDASPLGSHESPPSSSDSSTR